MLRNFRSVLVSGCAALALCSGALADEDSTAPSADQVVASVNGTDITLGHVIALRQGLPQQYDQFPPELLFRGILDQLVQHELLSQSLGEDASLRTRIAIENETRALMAGQLMNEVIADGPSDAELEELYDSEFPADMEDLEYRASHILVESEDDAKSLVDELKGGADFAALAREHSTGPSGESGGDLGWFGDGDMVEPFFAAVSSLSPGDVSEPVQTQFGWHVITLAETRQKERPALDAVRPELIEQYRQAKLERFLADLREQAEVSEFGVEEIDPAVIVDYQLLER